MSLTAYDIISSNMESSIKNILSKNAIIFYILEEDYFPLESEMIKNISINYILSVINNFAERNLFSSIIQKDIKIFMVHCNIKSSFEEKTCEGFSFKFDESYAIVISDLSDPIHILIHEICHVLIDCTFNITDDCDINKLECIVEAIEYFVIKEYLNIDLGINNNCNFDSSKNYDDNLINRLISDIKESKNYLEPIRRILC